MFKARHREKLARAADALGLEHDGELLLRGTLGDLDAEVRHWSKSVGDGQEPWTTTRVLFPAPLRMGLRIVPSTIAGRFMARMLDSPGLVSGEKSFDERYRVTATDLRRARAVIQSAAIRHQLLDVHGVGVRDTDARVVERGWTTDAKHLRARLERCVPIARAIATLRPEIPKSEAEERSEAALHALANEVALEVDAPRLWAEGRAGMSSASIAAVYRDDDEYETHTRMMFPEPLGFGLTLTPRHGFWSRVGDWLGMRDLRVGHADFDRSFRLRGQPAGGVVPLFRGEVAGWVVALKETTHELHIDDLGVRVVQLGYPRSTRTLRRDFDACAKVANALAERAFGASRLPYR